MLLLVALFSLTGARAQEELTVYENATGTNGYVPVYGYYADAYNKCEFVIPANELSDMQGGTISQMTFYLSSPASDSWGSAEFQVFMKEVNDATISAFSGTADATIVYEGSLDGTQSEMTIEFTPEYQYQGGNLLVGIYQTETGSYKSATFTGAEVSGASISGYSYSSFDAISATQRNFVPKTTFTYTPLGGAPAVARPKGLEVIYNGGTEATVRWNSEEEVFDIEVNGEVTENVENGITLTGLELATTYTIRVRAKKGTEVSNWSSPVSFTTDACLNPVVVKYTLSDSYGDGWNGNYIYVYDEDDNLVATLTIESGASKTGSLKLCGSLFTFYWYAGSYPTETSWTFTDADGNELFSGAGSSDMATGDVLYEIDLSDWRRPTDFAVSQVSPISAVLSWTENSLTPATSWIIAYIAEGDEDVSYAMAESNPFTLEDLTPETTYQAMVSPYNDEGVLRWSNLISFTTPTYTPAPTDIAITPLVTTAEVSWDGSAESYELEYAEGSFGSGWMQYDNGNYESGIGNSTAGTWTWGVMYPGSMVTSNSLTKVSIYEVAEYNTADITINIYSGGDDAPGSLIYTETVTPKAANAFHEITLASPVAVTPGENLWITLTEYGTYVLAYCASDESNNNWVQSGDSWAHVSDLSSDLAGSGWMIRAEMVGNDPSTATWIPVSNPSSPCTLEGLTAETTYTVRIRGYYGSEGYSAWAMMAFTTKSGNEAPVDLAATNVKDTNATLKWTGYQESYNLRYRNSTAAPTAPATIIFTAGDVWGDGSGYQMLLDADATAYGDVFSGTGGWTATDFSAFEYMIPVNAECDMNTTAVVFNNSVTIQIPAGTYDWCILNPSPGDKIYIAAQNGNVGGRQNDYVFEAGKTYEFVPSIYGNNDGIDVTITYPVSEWTVVENVTAPYEFTGLTPETYYEWQVQGILAGGTTEWSELSSFTTTEQLIIVELFDGEDNTDYIETDIAVGTSINVQLTGRTLYKDGSWNTICLPFGVTVADSPLAGATVYELDTENSSLTTSTLTLNFTPATVIEAGKPYLIKWTSGENITDPIIYDVTSPEEGWEAQDVTACDGAITFTGTYDPVSFEAGDESILYVGASNKLYYPSAAVTMNAFRAYFQIDESKLPSKHIALKFGSDDATGISSVEAGNGNETIYNVAGMRMSKAQKGVNIVNGKKILK